MIKNIAILAISSFVLISCGTSTKTTSSTRSSKKEAVSIKEKSKTNEAALRSASSPNLRKVSVADSKRVPSEMKKQTIQKVK